MLLDLIFLAVIIAFIIIGAVRGLAKVIMNIAAVVASCVLSNVYSSVVAEWIFDSFVRADLINKLNSAVSQTEITLSGAMEKLPGWVSSVVSLFCSIFGFDEQRLSESFLKNTITTQTTSAQLTDDFVKPIVTGIFTFFIAIIMFILLMVVFKLIIKLVNKLFELPILNPINRVLGGVFGAVEGVVVAIICIALIATILNLNNSASTVTEGISGIAFSIFKR